jgi:hypothetical protein
LKNIEEMCEHREEETTSLGSCKGFYKKNRRRIISESGVFVRVLDMNGCELLAEIVFCTKETTHNEEKSSAFLSYCCAILLKICCDSTKPNLQRGCVSRTVSLSC